MSKNFNANLYKKFKILSSEFQIAFPQDNLTHAVLSLHKERMKAKKDFLYPVTKHNSDIKERTTDERYFIFLIPLRDFILFNFGPWREFLR